MYDDQPCGVADTDGHDFLSLSELEVRLDESPFCSGSIFSAKSFIKLWIPFSLSEPHVASYRHRYLARCISPRLPPSTCVKVDSSSGLTVCRNEQAVRAVPCACVRGLDLAARLSPSCLPSILSHSQSSPPQLSLRWAFRTGPLHTVASSQANPTGGPQKSTQSRTSTPASTPATEVRPLPTQARRAPNETAPTKTWVPSTNPSPPVHWPPSWSASSRLCWMDGWVDCS